MNYKDISDDQRNKLAIQYEPLVNKITKQFVDKVKISWNDIKCMAWEGLAIAIQNYDDTRSSMSFTQFAGFAIRNNILTSLDKELRTVKLSNYAQKKAIAAGEPIFNSISIDSPVSDGTDLKPREIVMNMYQNEKFSDGDLFEYLYSRIEDEFYEKDCQMFYMHFGLKEYDEMKGKDIAKYFGVSEGLVSQKIKKIITFIKKDNDLCEMMAKLIEQ